MKFDMQGTGLELEGAQADMGALWPEPLDEAGEGIRTPAAHEGQETDLAQVLARHLAWAQGEDPDAQPYPLRFPRWRFYYPRARMLMAISPAEHSALAAVLAREPLQPALPGGTARPA